MTTENESTTEQPQETSLRDDIEAAIATAEVEMTAESAGSEEVQTTEESAPQPAEGEAGATAEATEQEQPTEDAGAAGDRPDGAAADTTASERYPDDAERYPNLAEKVGKPPAKWRPAAREGWDKLPEDVRREIHRRELDLDRLSRDGAESRRHHEAFNKAIDPYRPLIAAEGAGEPLEAVTHLLQTAATLAQGAPGVKAERIAQLINHYGVDLGLLDKVLTANMRGETPDVDDGVSQVIDQKLSPIIDFMQRLDGQIQDADQRNSAETRQTIEEFAADKEFMSDVRMDMADLLDMAAQRGRAMTLQEAYDTACSMNPEIREVLARRSAQTSSEAVQRKEQLAETSPTGRQTGTPPAESNGNLRDDIARAFDAVADRRSYN